MEIFINYSSLRDEGPPQKIQVVCLWTDYSHVTITYNICLKLHGTWHVVYWYVVYCVSRTVHKSSLMVFKYQTVDQHTYFCDPCRLWMCDFKFQWWFLRCKLETISDVSDEFAQSIVYYYQGAFGLCHSQALSPCKTRKSL